MIRLLARLTARALCLCLGHEPQEFGHIVKASRKGLFRCPRCRSYYWGAL